MIVRTLRLRGGCEHGEEKLIADICDLYERTIDIAYALCYQMIVANNLGVAGRMCACACHALVGLNGSKDDRRGEPAIARPGHRGV